MFRVNTSQWTDAQMFEKNIKLTWSRFARVPYGYAVDFNDVDKGEVTTIHGTPPAYFHEEYLG